MKAEGKSIMNFICKYECAVYRFVAKGLHISYPLASSKRNKHPVRKLPLHIYSIFLSIYTLVCYVAGIQENTQND